MRKAAKAKLTKVKVAIPFGIGEAEWGPDTSERDAAWALYVELVTRTAIQPLPADAGICREALSSLHTLFGTTRQVLRTAGPSVGAHMPSVGGIAIRVLNSGLRPFLTKWHTKLVTWEAGRSSETPVTQHEAAWPELVFFRSEFDELRRDLERYAVALAAIAGV
jgi:hypothetical protein